MGRREPPKRQACLSLGATSCVCPFGDGDGLGRVGSDGSAVTARRSFSGSRARSRSQAATAPIGLPDIDEPHRLYVEPMVDLRTGPWYEEAVRAWTQEMGG